MSEVELDGIEGVGIDENASWEQPGDVKYNLVRLLIFNPVNHSHIT